jgi:hypothetical protein
MYEEKSGNPGFYAIFTVSGRNEGKLLAVKQEKNKEMFETG